MTVFEKMTALANAVREKTGASAPLTIDGMIAAVNSFQKKALPANIAMGQFRISKEQELGDFTIPHGLSGIPNIVLVYTDRPELLFNHVRGTITFNLGEEYDDDNGYYPSISVRRGFWDSASSIAQTSTAYTYSDNRETFTVPSLTSNRLYDTNLTYYWIAVRF